MKCASDSPDPCLPDREEQEVECKEMDIETTGMSDGCSGRQWGMCSTGTCVHSFSREVEEDSTEQRIFYLRGTCGGDEIAVNPTSNASSNLLEIIDEILNADTQSLATPDELEAR